MYDPNDVPDNISGARDDAPMEMKPLPANVPQFETSGSFEVSKCHCQRLD